MELENIVHWFVYVITPTCEVYMGTYEVREGGKQLSPYMLPGFKIVSLNNEYRAFNPKKGRPKIYGLETTNVNVYVVAEDPVDKAYFEELAKHDVCHDYDTYAFSTAIRHNAMLKHYTPFATAPKTLHLDDCKNWYNATHGR